MTTLAGLGREIGVVQDLCELRALMARVAVLHRLRIRQMHAVRHVNVVHERALVREQSHFLRRQRSAAGPG